MKFSGFYTACDHVYKKEADTLLGYPGMFPAEPWALRLEPEISWPTVTLPDSFYTVLLIDIGFGRLNYLAYNFPHDLKVRHKKIFVGHKKIFDGKIFF